MNLSDSHSERTEKLRDWMSHFSSKNQAWRTEGKSITVDELDPETIAELKALGYLGGDD